MTELSERRLLTPAPGAIGFALIVAAGAQAELNWTYPQPLNSDADEDGDANPADGAFFQKCFAAAEPPAGCAAHDFDCSGAVDLVDFAFFAARVNGPG